MQKKAKKGKSSKVIEVQVQKHLKFMSYKHRRSPSKNNSTKKKKRLENNHVENKYLIIRSSCYIIREGQLSQLTHHGSPNTVNIADNIPNYHKIQKGRKRASHQSHRSSGAEALEVQVL